MVVTSGDRIKSGDDNLFLYLEIFFAPTVCGGEGRKQQNFWRSVVMPKRQRSVSPLGLIVTVVAALIAVQVETSCVLAALQMNEEDELPEPSQFWETRALFFDERRFKLHFRVPQVVFNTVLERIKDHPVFRVPSNVGRRAVPVAKQLAIFLMRMGYRKGATGKVADIMGASLQRAPAPLVRPPPHRGAPRTRRVCSACGVRCVRA